MKSCGVIRESWSSMWSKGRTKERKNQRQRKCGAQSQNEQKGVRSKNDDNDKHAWG